MIIIIALLSFALPLLLRKFFEVLQGVMAIGWIVLLFIMPNQFPPSDLEGLMQRILFIALPMWVFGSLIAVKMRSGDVSTTERKFHENVFHHEKQ